MPDLRPARSGSSPEAVLAAAIATLTAGLADLRSTVLARYLTTEVAAAAYAPLHGSYYKSATAVAGSTTAGPSFVTLDTNVEQTGTSKDGDNYTIHVSKAGLWLVEGSVGMAARPSDGAVDAILRHNNAQVRRVRAATNGSVDSTTQVAAVRRCAANDHFRLLVTPVAGGTVNPDVLGGGDTTFMTLTYLGA